MPLDLAHVDLTAETVRTDRLVLRPPGDADVDPIVRAFGDPEMHRWLTAPPFPYTRADAVEFITGIAPSGRVEGTDLGVRDRGRRRARRRLRAALPHGRPA